ncbi:hypothetical protein [Pseudoalteromonas galatheae]|uniref:hypothetical protein n=1 Tax=Pseudoalteromonas galatheae TaxID=579562 RepID=UPI0030CC5976
MSKAEAFKKWYSERTGHPAQIKAAYEAILELEESTEDSKTESYGDGWYDGFLKAKELDGNEDYYLSDTDEDEIREMSEYAESKHSELKAKVA